MLQKILIITKKDSNKNRSELNFLQKSQQTHISISFRSGVRGSKSCHFLNIIMYWNGKVDSI